jgi:hypothetical protein
LSFGREVLGFNDIRRRLREFFIQKSQGLSSKSCHSYHERIEFQSRSFLAIICTISEEIRY